MTMEITLSQKLKSVFRWISSPKSGAGFTIIEALVSATIFAVASVSIVGVYLAVQRLNQASRSLNAVQQNARFVMEDIAKLVRNGQVNYVSYGGRVPQPSTRELLLLDRDGTPIRIYFDAGNQTVLLEKTGSGPTGYVGREVSVLDFRVYIWPDTDPFLQVSPQEQPTVTVYMDLQSNLNPRHVERAQVQTTVATREYPR